MLFLVFVVLAFSYLVQLRTFFRVISIFRLFFQKLAKTEKIICNFNKAGAHYRVMDS